MAAFTLVYACMRIRICAVIGCGGSFGIWLLHRDIPILLGAACGCCALAYLLAVLDTRPAVLGPFFSMER